MQEKNSQTLDLQIKMLEEEIELVTYNYENMLRNEKTQTQQRSEFILSMIQSLRARHLEELDLLQEQIQSSQQELSQSTELQRQMESIGNGVSSIMSQSEKLKEENNNLKNSLNLCINKEKSLDERIRKVLEDRQEARTRIEQEEIKRVKGRRKIKDMMELIEKAEIEAKNPKSPETCTSPKGFKKNQREKVESEINGNICEVTGENEETCDHCEKTKIEKLLLKYNKNTK